jgi:hypothetical protein
MKKPTLIAISAIALIASLTVAGSAQATAPAKAGAACATAGAKTTIASKSYTCVKALSGKLVWTLSSAATTGAGAGSAFADRGAAMKKYSDCLVAHGGTAMAFGGPGGSRGAGNHNGTFPTPSAAQQKAVTACASLAPKFGGFGGHRNGAFPARSASPSASN